MTRDRRTDWLALTLVLCASWLFITSALGASIAVLDVALPGFITRSAPFLVPGLIAGRFVGAPERRPRITAAAVLAVVSAAVWTWYWATASAHADRILARAALSLLVSLFGGALAYFGMFLGDRRRQGPSAGRTVAEIELDDLEQELRKEAALDRPDRTA